MKDKEKIQILQEFDKLPDEIRAAVCAGYAIGKMENSKKGD